jgi:hypothetical protein
MCLDHPEVQTLIGQIEDRRIVTYGTNPQADVRFSDVSMAAVKSTFSVTIRDRRSGRDGAERTSFCRCPACTTFPMRRRRSPSPPSLV